MTAGSGLRLFPQAFEPVPGNAGVMGRVLGISLAEAQKTLANKRQELARVIEHLRSPGLSSGLLWELRKNATNLERERAEIEQAR